ncbi:MAG TPA: class IV adenylate cyclase [Terriglobales bacterium]|jgi:adenylate cyclase class 2
MPGAETEIKFRLLDRNALERELKAAGFKLQTPRTLEVNTLYDCRTHSLRRKGELLRLRSYGPRWVLTHKAKGKTGRHKVRMEAETRVDDGEQMVAILCGLGYRPSFRYEKFRTEWTDGTGHVVLDETPIGNFGEIEGPADWIDSTAARLGISQKEYITLNYAGLFSDWKRRTRSRAREMTFVAVSGTQG